MKIHSDVWGPAKVPSFSGSRYFVTFIDDCTRMTWVAVLKKKSEVFEKIVDFLQCGGKSVPATYQNFPI